MTSYFCKDSPLPKTTDQGKKKGLQWSEGSWSVEYFAYLKSHRVLNFEGKSLYLEILIFDFDLSFRAILECFTLDARRFVELVQLLHYSRAR